MYFRPTYKCRMCGTIIASGNWVEMTREEASEAVNRAVGTDDLFGSRFGPKKSMVIHNCQDAGIGIADLQGMQAISDTVAISTYGDRKPWYKRIFKG